jgi:hypothetical protein
MPGKPSNGVYGHEFRRAPTIRVNVNKIATSSARLPHVSALRIPWIYDHWLILSDDPAIMDMPQGPIVHASPSQVLNRARRVGLVPRVLPDVAVKQPDGVHVAVTPPESRG